MTISAWYDTLPKIIMMTIQNPMTSHFGKHPGKQLVSGPEKIPSYQHLENESQQLYSLLGLRNPYILGVRRSILPWRRRMNTSLRRWHPRRYSISHLDNWLRLLMYMLGRDRIHMNPLSNWLCQKLQACCEMTRVSMTWQASSSAQNTMPR